VIRNRWTRETFTVFPMAACSRAVADDLGERLRRLVGRFRAGSTTPGATWKRIEL
jgi:hypothetical protein